MSIPIKTFCGRDADVHVMPKKEKDPLNNLAIFCADVGSIKQNKFGWAAELANGSQVSGSSIEEYSDEIARQIKSKVKVAVGFECPLFVPVRSDPILVN